MRNFAPTVENSPNPWSPRWSLGSAAAPVRDSPRNLAPESQLLLRISAAGWRLRLAIVLSAPTHAPAFRLLTKILSRRGRLMSSSKLWGKILVQELMAGPCTMSFFFLFPAEFILRVRVFHAERIHLLLDFRNSSNFASFRSSKNASTAPVALPKTVRIGPDPYSLFRLGAGEQPHSPVRELRLAPTHSSLAASTTTSSAMA